MHDIDRTLQEFEMGNQQEYVGESSFANEAYEFGQELMPELGMEANYEWESLQEYGGLNQEDELLQELLSLQSEDELNHFIGGLLSKAAGAASSLVRSPVGQGVGRFLVNLGQKTLPQLGRNLGGKAGGAVGGRLGTALGQRVGGSVGGKVGNWAGNALGTKAGGALGGWAGQKAGNWLSGAAKNVFNLELGGLSQEQAEYELNRAYNRFAYNTARRANMYQRRYPRIPARQIIRRSIYDTAQTYAPGLVYRNNDSNDGADFSEVPTGGRWERRNNTIVIYLD